MPPKFDVLKHPRDRKGRFTKSRTVLAGSADKKLVKDIAAGFKPVPAGDGKAYTAKIADPQQQKTAGHFALDAKEINQDLRAGHTDAAGVKPMDDAMRPLPDDVVLHRSVPKSAFGGVDPQALQGMKVRDAGFSATQLDQHPAAKDDVRMFIAAPKGSRAVVNAGTGEVYLDRDSEMVVSHVEANSAGGHDMYLTLLPKKNSGGKDSKATPDSPAKTTKPDPKAPPEKPAEPDKPHGKDDFRASLMKYKVAHLQAQMRDRGLKPGRKRKSELVDALVADEMGTSADKHTGNHADYGARIAAAATGQDALDATPLSLVRTDTHSRLGHRQGLTVEQRAALSDYQGADYAVINGRLRDLDEGLDDVSAPNTAAQTEHLDAAMAASKLPRDVVVYRGISRSRKVFGDRIDANLTGMTWREAAFVSTTAERAFADPFAGRSREPVRMRILAPAGLGAVQVSGMVDAAGHQDEAELLLDRGTQMRVAADRGVVDGVRHLDVEVVL